MGSTGKVVIREHVLELNFAGCVGIRGQAAAGSVLATGQLYCYPENKQSGDNCLGQSVKFQTNTAARTQPQGPPSPEHPVPPEVSPEEDHTLPRTPTPGTYDSNGILFCSVL